MSATNDRRFLGIAGTAAGAGIASAIAGLFVPVVPVLAPILGGVAAVLTMALSGIFTDPTRVVHDIEPAE